MSISASEGCEWLKEWTDSREIQPRWAVSGLEVGPGGRDHDFGTRLADLLVKAEGRTG